MNKTIKNKPIITISVLAIILASFAVFLFVSRNSDENREIISSYMACGCGGCGGEPEKEIKYYSKSKGEETAYTQAVQDDKETAKKDYCKLVGCSLCTKLVLVE
jgi:Co/Zn/Cd efflux system component